jgi:hypothetical protein
LSGGNPPAFGTKTTGGTAAHRSFRTACVDPLLIGGHRRAAGFFIRLYADNPPKTQASRRLNPKL